MENADENGIVSQIRPRSASFTVGQRPTRLRSLVLKPSPLASSDNKQNIQKNSKSESADKIVLGESALTQDGSGMINDSMETASVVSSSTILEDNVLTNYCPNYTSPRTLTGTKQTYHFPSPMHAVLMQYKDSMKDQNDKENNTHVKKDIAKEKSEDANTSEKDKSQEDVSQMENHGDRIAALAKQRRRFSADERMLRMKNILKDISISNPKITKLVHSRLSKSSSRLNILATEETQLRRTAGSAPTSPRSPIIKHGIFFSEQTGSLTDMTTTSSPHQNHTGKNLAGSKSSLNSEEGYFSRPNSPVTKRGHKLSIRSDNSVSSNGSSLSSHVENNIEENMDDTEESKSNDTEKESQKENETKVIENTKVDDDKETKMDISEEELNVEKHIIGVDSSSKIDSSAKVDCSVKVDCSSKVDSSPKADSFHKVDCFDKGDCSAKADSFPKADSSPKVDCSDNVDCSSKVDCSPNADSSPKVDCSPKVVSSPKVISSNITVCLAKVKKNNGNLNRETDMNNNMEENKHKLVTSKPRLRRHGVVVNEIAVKINALSKTKTEDTTAKTVLLRNKTLDFQDRKPRPMSLQIWGSFENSDKSMNVKVPGELVVYSNESSNLSRSSSNTGKHHNTEPDRHRMSASSCSSPSPRYALRHNNDKRKLQSTGTGIARRHSFSPGHTAISSGSYITHQSIFYMRNTMSHVQDTLV